VPDERLSDERLAEIEKRCAAATPGPWVQADLWLPWLQWLWSQARKAWGYTADPDFFFIAHARADAPALVAEVRRLRAVERELRGHVRALVGRVEALAEGGAHLRPECHAADVPEVDDDGPAI
jgi:hypothetical protein